MREIFSTGKKHISVFFVIIVIVCAATAISSAAKTQYWESSHLQGAVLDLTEYNDSIEENDSNLDGIKEIVHKCNETATPVRTELSPFFEAYNQMIINYFEDIYKVDVSDKLQVLQVMEAPYPEEISQMVGGSHSSDFPKKLFINSVLLEDLSLNMKGGELPEISSEAFSLKMLRTVYIHEVMHYLGFNSNIGFDHFMEAIAESLNKEVMLHSNIKYESITGYAPIQGFANQILKCDAEFIKEVLTGSNPDMVTYFNNKLGDTFEINYAEYYDKLIGLIQKNDSKDIGKITYYTQYLTYEYCKLANSNARDILNTNNESPVSMFEVKWFLRIG